MDLKFLNKATLRCSRRCRRGFVNSLIAILEANFRKYQPKDVSTAKSLRGYLQGEDWLIGQGMVDCFRSFLQVSKGGFLQKISHFNGKELPIKVG